MILHLKLNFSICYNTRITHGFSSVSKDSMKLGWCFEYALVHNHYMRRGGGRQGQSLDRLAIDTCICLTAYKSRHFAIVETIPLELSGEDGVLLIVISTGFLGTKHAGESCFAVQQCHAAESLRTSSARSGF